MQIVDYPKFGAIATDCSYAPAIFPDAKPVPGKPGWHVIPNADDTKRARLEVLRQIVEREEPEDEEEPEVRPKEYQERTIAFLSANPRAFILNEQGTGKTLSVCWALQRSNGRALVCAPLSVLGSWEKDAARIGLSSVIVHGSCVGDRLRHIADNPDCDLYLTNHDGVAPLAGLFAQMANKGMLTHLVIDEADCYRNPFTDKTKAMIQLAAHFKHRWSLTGTPTPNAWTDAWSAIKIINPDRVGSFSEFRDATMVRLSRSKWTNRPGGERIVYNAMQPSMRVVLDDVESVPECKSSRIEVQMGKNQALRYSESNGLHGKHQAAAGFETNNGRTIRLDNDAQMKALLDTIKQAPHKLIVYTHYRSALAGISAVLNAAGIEHAIVNGGVSRTSREKIFSEFQSTGKYKVLLGQPRAFCYGVTLTAATTVVWFGPTPSAVVFAQANARVRRIGQENDQEIVMISSNGMQRRAMNKVMGKLDRQSKLLELYN